MADAPARVTADPGVPPSGLRRGLAALATADRVDLVAAMTLIVLLVSGGGSWYLRIPVAMLGGAAFLVPALRLRPWLWLALTAALAWGYGSEWFLVDNHKYLFTYWCLAMFLALRTDEPAAALRVSSRWLLALCFLFATLWKLFSPDFLDGTFFHYAFLTDTRLRGAAELLGGLPAGAGAANHRALEALVGYSAKVSDLQLTSAPSVAVAARVVAIATPLVEGLVALAFLVPERFGLARLRPWALVAFVLGTYALAPVVAFGWILLVLGVAEARPGSRAVPVYVTVFLLLPLYRVPWYELLTSLR